MIPRTPATTAACAGTQSESAAPIVLIAYENLRAARYAFNMIGRAFANAHSIADFHPILWSFDRLSEGASHPEATGDAAQADILVIAASGTAPFSSALKQWLAASLLKKRGQTAAVVTLVAPAEPAAPSGSAIIDFLRLIAEQAGLDFFASESQQSAVAQPEKSIHSISGPDLSS